MIFCNTAPVPAAKVLSMNWNATPTSPMGIAAGFGVPEVCGMARTGAAEGVELAFDAAVTATLAGATAADEPEVLEFVEPKATGSAIIDRGESAERTSLATFAAGVAVVAGSMALISISLVPTEVVLNCNPLVYREFD